MRTSISLLHAMMEKETIVTAMAIASPVTLRVPTQKYALILILMELENASLYVRSARAILLLPVTLFSFLLADLLSVNYQ